jgi:hypothetical protein
MAHNPRQLAFEWLKGEDAYQWRRGETGKFPLADDIKNLYVPDTWSVVISNYWSRSLHYRGEDFAPQTIQNIGKLAASCRALLVTLTAERASGPLAMNFPAANAVSLQLLAGEVDAVPDDTLADWQATDFDVTKTAQALAAIPLPLSQGKPIEVAYIKSAKEASIHSMGMLAGVIDYALERGVALPRPAINSSDDIQPWHI